MQTVVPHSEFFGHLVAYGEMAIGISLLLGCLVRLSAAFGLFHNLNIYLAVALPVGGPQLGLNRIFIAMEAMFLITAAGRALGLDGVLKSRYPQSKLF